MLLGIEGIFMNDLSVFLKILSGIAFFVLGYYSYRRVIKPDKVGFHKFNFEWKFKRKAFIYALMLWGLIMVARELVILIWF